MTQTGKIVKWWWSILSAVEGVDYAYSTLYEDAQSGEILFLKEGEYRIQHVIEDDRRVQAGIQKRIKVLPCTLQRL